MRVLVIGSGPIGRRHHESLGALAVTSRLVSWRDAGLGGAIAANGRHAGGCGGDRNRCASSPDRSRRRPGPNALCRKAACLAWARIVAQAWAMRDFVGQITKEFP
jgi:hypothetical protein